MCLQLGTCLLDQTDLVMYNLILPRNGCMEGRHKILQIELQKIHRTDDKVKERRATTDERYEDLGCYPACMRQIIYCEFVILKTWCIYLFNRNNLNMLTKETYARTFCRRERRALINILK
jgi:hypothetical protein